MIYSFNMISDQALDLEYGFSIISSIAQLFDLNTVLTRYLKIIMDSWNYEEVSASCW